MALTHERLRELLHYDPETGVFTWRVTRGRALVGAVAGFNGAHGYRYIKIDQVNHFEHRMAWLYVHGSHPLGEIDHKNEAKADNRIANLRDVSRMQNMHNQRAARRGNLSGLRGVDWHQGKWQARIQVNKRAIYLGVFEAKELAKEFRDLAAEMLSVN